MIYIISSECNYYYYSVFTVICRDCFLWKHCFDITCLHALTLIMCSTSNIPPRSNILVPHVTSLSLPDWWPARVLGSDWSVAGPLPEDKSHCDDVFSVLCQCCMRSREEDRPVDPT